MSPERHQQISRLYHAVLELPPGERNAFLARACKGDDALRKEVESLVSSHEQPATFLDKGALGAAVNPLADDHVEFSVGQRIAQYEIIAPLGTGGMGEVYLADDKKMGRRVALKVLPGFFTQDPQRVRRFKQEAQVVVALNHPNIVTIYDIGQDESIHFIATELIEGETLRQRASDAGLKLSETIEVAIQVTSALVAAHQAGVVHRDIKPDNIMLRADGYVKVLDFGLAKLLEKDKAVPTDSAVATRALVKTDAGVVMGTASYMSPEQARGAVMDARTDIWSLGVVIYELAAGRLPFEGATPTEAIARIIEREPAPLARYAPELPAELERIVTKALTKDREERYQTAKDLLIDLKRLKQRLEVESEIERVRVPEVFVESTSGGQVTDVTTSPPVIGPTHASSASSAEYVVTGLKHYKLTAVVTLLIIFAAVAGLWWYFHLPNSKVPINSIAILPFVNASGNNDVDYLSDGMTESLITSLSKLPNLAVKARGSVFRYKGKDVSPGQIGKELNVQAVLNGRVVQRGNDLTMHIELVDVKTETALWSEDYTRSMTNLVSLQSEIAFDVSRKLQLKLTNTDERQLAKHYTDNAEANQLYLRGMYEWKKHTKEDLLKSIEYYNQAIERDPNYALAYYGLAGSYGVLGNNYLPPNEASPKAKAYAAKALEIDETLAEAHLAMGAVNLYFDWNLAEADKEFKRALALDPNNVVAHHLAGDRLEIMGRFDEAKAERKRALELDPLSPLLNWVSGATLYLAGQYTEAIAQLEKTITLEPRYPPTYAQLGQAYEQKKMYAEAIATYQKGMTQAERNPQLIASLGHAYALSGERDKALKTLDELREVSKQQRYVSPYLFAVVYVGLGDKELAFAWLEKAFQDRSAALAWLKVEPQFDGLRSDPRFSDLTRRIGLTQ